jgi:hypothetical protein
MVNPSKQQVIDYINANSPITSKKAFSSIVSKIHEYNHHLNFTYEDLNEIFILFFSNVKKNFYLTTNQIFKFIKYSYIGYNFKNFVTMPWLKYNIEKGYVPDEGMLNDSRIQHIDFDSIYYLLKKYKDDPNFNRNIYFKNYHMLDKLFRNNDLIFNIDTKDPVELVELEDKIKFIDSFFEDTGLNSNDLLNKNNKIYIPYHIDKKNYNRDNIYFNFLQYRIYKNNRLTISELLVYREFCTKHNYNYLTKYFKKYSKNELKTELIKIIKTDHKSEIINFLLTKIVTDNSKQIQLNNNFEKEFESDSDISNDEDYDDDLKNLTFEQRLEMGLIKLQDSRLSLLDTTIFETFYNDKYDDELLEIISIIYDGTNLNINLFNILLNNGCTLTDKIFNLYCKIGDLRIIEIFLENKFKPGDEIFLNINYNNSTKIINLIKLFNKYNFYINDNIIPQMWNKFKNIDISDEIFKNSTIYINNDDEFNKILPQLQENYNKISEEKKILSTGTIYEINDYLKSNKLTIEMIIECENIEKRRNLLEIYKEQNINNTNNNTIDITDGKKRIIKRIIKKKVV